MNEKDLILEAMNKAGVPLNAGKIAELTGLDRKVVDTLVRSTGIDNNGTVVYTLPGTEFKIIVGDGGAVVVPGDVNGDGVCNSGDVTILYNYFLDGATEGLVNGDVDGDGSITSGDITFIYNLLLGSAK